MTEKEQMYYFGFIDKQGLMIFISYPIPESECESYFRWTRNLDITKKVVRCKVGNVEELVDDGDTREHK